MAMILLDEVEGHRVVDAAVDQHAAVAYHRAEHRRNGGRGRQRRLQVALGEDRELVAEIVGRRHLERDLQLLESRRDGRGQEGLEDALDIELADADAALHGFGDRARPRAPHARGHLGAAAEDRAAVIVDFGPSHAGGHAGAHDGADGGAGDRHRLDAELVQRLDGVDMRQSPRAAAAEGNREGRVHPLPLPATCTSGGPITIIAGSTDRSFLASALTCASVTASIRAARRLM